MKQLIITIALLSLVSCEEFLRRNEEAKIRNIMERNQKDKELQAAYEAEQKEAEKIELITSSVRVYNYEASGMKYKVFTGGSSQSGTFVVNVTKDSLESLRNEKELESYQLFDKYNKEYESRR